MFFVHLPYETSQLKTVARQLRLSGLALSMPAIRMPLREERDFIAALTATTLYLLDEDTTNDVLDRAIEDTEDGRKVVLVIAPSVTNPKGERLRALAARRRIAVFGTLEGATAHLLVRQRMAAATA